MDVHSVGSQATGNETWARNADLGQEGRLRDRMPAAQRDREDRKRAADRHAERGESRPAPA